MRVVHRIDDRGPKQEPPLAIAVIECVHIATVRFVLDECAIRARETVRDVHVALRAGAIAFDLDQDIRDRVRLGERLHEHGYHVVGKGVRTAADEIVVVTSALREAPRPLAGTVDFPSSKQSSRLQLRGSELRQPIPDHLNLVWCELILFHDDEDLLPV